MRKRILDLLKNNSRLSNAEIAAMIGADEAVVENEIKAMEKEKVICGYNTMIDYEKLGEDRVLALIGVKISPVRGEGFDRIANRISRFDEVSSVYLMSGSSHDLILTIEGDSLKDISFFVYNKIAPMDTVVSTATYFVLKKYKDHNVVITDEPDSDERIQMML